MSQDLLNELANEFWRSAGVMEFSRVGLKRLVDGIPWQVTEENPDPMLYLGAGDPNDPATVADASWPRSVLDEAATADGWLQEWLTQAWIAMVYARWENYYRQAFADAHGTSVAHVRSDVIGDIRLLRTTSSTTTGSRRPGTPGAAGF